MTPDEEFDRKLAAARERIRKELKALKDRSKIGSSKEIDASRKYFFQPFATMFKLTELDRTTAPIGSRRKVQCVNCGARILLSVFLDYQCKFESKCYSCDMTAEEYWNGKLHRKVS